MQYWHKHQVNFFLHKYLSQLVKNIINLHLFAVQVQKSAVTPEKSSASSTKPVATPTKAPEPAAPRSPVVKQSPVKSPRKASLANSATRDNRAVNKENGENSVTSVRSKLQRLGKLYSGTEPSV